jgi:hypothetical protein
MQKRARTIALRKMRNKMAGIEAKIPVLFFQEGKKVIAYSPALDLSSCGDTEQQARKRFAEAALIFLSEIHKMGTMEEVLEECGWHKVPDQNTWAPPVYKSCTEESVKIPAGV